MVEQVLAETLRPVLARLPDGAAIPESEAFTKAANALAWFVRTVLAEIHPEWHELGLDGIDPVGASRPSQ
jgi:hypothetical protein